MAIDRPNRSRPLVHLPIWLHGAHPARQYHWRSLARGRAQLCPGRDKLGFSRESSRTSVKEAHRFHRCSAAFPGTYESACVTKLRHATMRVKENINKLEVPVQMSAEQIEHNWWAEGDLPVRSDSQVTFLVDGHHALWTMCVHFLTARQSIHLANWGLTADMLMVRGSDHRAGPDGSPEQNALVAELQAAGLSAQDIQFWCSQELTVQNVLGYAVQKGVDVKVLLWACPEAFSHYSPKTAHEKLTAIGVNCLLDGSASRLPHPSESLHQKISIADNQFAFVGGIDPLIELNGDFDRWDTPWHDLVSRLRSNPKDA